MVDELIPNKCYYYIFNTLGRVAVMEIFARKYRLLNISVMEIFARKLRWEEEVFGVLGLIRPHLLWHARGVLVKEIKEVSV